MVGILTLLRESKIAPVLLNIHESRRCKLWLRGGLSILSSLMWSSCSILTILHVILFTRLNLAITMSFASVDAIELTFVPVVRVRSTFFS